MSRDTGWVQGLSELLAGWDAALRVGHAAEAQRALDEADDLFLLLCFSESMGLSNPAAWHTLELYPLLLEAFHDWHRRAGMDRSPLDHIRCC
ncbi:MAG: hypothetical protein JJU27_11750 [Gammaproteobacteria bacterium]|nr:hypothetical protein [Gammaproteobacteria bacterium]